MKERHWGKVKLVWSASWHGSSLSNKFWCSCLRIYDERSYLHTSLGPYMSIVIEKYEIEVNDLLHQIFHEIIGINTSFYVLVYPDHENFQHFFGICLVLEVDSEKTGEKLWIVLRSGFFWATGGVVVDWGKFQYISLLLWSHAYKERRKTVGVNISPNF